MTHELAIAYSATKKIEILFLIQRKSYTLQNQYNNEHGTTIQIVTKRLAMANSIRVCRFTLGSKWDINKKDSI